MTTTYELECRLCDDTTEHFESVEATNNSEWSNISALGVVADGVSTHKGYCPGHTIDTDK